MFKCCVNQIVNFNDYYNEMAVMNPKTQETLKELTNSEIGT